MHKAWKQCMQLINFVYSPSSYSDIQILQQAISLLSYYSYLVIGNKFNCSLVNPYWTLLKLDISNIIGLLI